MTEQPHRPRPRDTPSPGQIFSTVLILLAVIAWVVIVILGIQLQEQLDRNLRLIMELAKHAGI